jgi:drug/metabolite transporter (DMT)-like permease
MEQTTQQITQKPSVPIKTKIAAWWIIIGGIIYAGYSFFSSYNFYKLSNALAEKYGMVTIPLSTIIYQTFGYLLVPCVIGFFLLKRKKLAWEFAALFLALAFVEEILTLLIAVSKKDISKVNILVGNFFLVTIPLILLILDRKNFFKIAT